MEIHVVDDISLFVGIKRCFGLIFNSCVVMNVYCEYGNALICFGENQNLKNSV